MARYVSRPGLLILLALLALPAIAAESENDQKAKEKPTGYNVLFIAVDDLRPELGCYGAEHMHTPNIDRLASQGTLFNRAYCQQAVCNPSRASLMTGLRPDTTKVHDLRRHFRIALPDVVTLAQYFKQHGYHTQAISKIYHRGLEDPQSWSVPQMRPQAPTYIDPKIRADIRRWRREAQAQGTPSTRESGKTDPKTGTTLVLGSRRGPRVSGPAWESPDVADNVLTDGKTADRCVELLRQFKKEGKQFFLGAGFLKPHLPFIAPKRYFDLYPLDQVELPDNMFPPADVPQLALHNSGELRSYCDVPDEGPIPREQMRKLLQAYRACASYVDAQIGRLLDELDRLGLRDNTVVVLWGDHGWHLGEQNLWGKMTNFEIATRVPMVISAPGQKHAGAKTDALSEFVDIYPTLCELCGLPVPDGLEGTSLAPVMDRPDRPWKTAAFSQYPRPGLFPNENRIGQMGYSLRTQRYRYTEWQDWKTGKVVARELYDYETDPAGNVNIANDPANKDLVATLSQQLSEGWQGAKPKE